MMLVIIGMALLGTVVSWYVMGGRGLLSPALRAIQGVTIPVLAVLFVACWLRLLPQPAIELGCLAYAVSVCAACMVLRMYVPRYGAEIDLEPLYLWVPVFYVFAFVVTDHRRGALLAIGIIALLVAVSTPSLVHSPDSSYANITVQLFVVSAAVIATLYFFSGYQHRLRLVEASVGQLAQLSATDDLTHLPNRRHMATQLVSGIATLASGRGFAVMLFDVDHFKEINDQFGHAAGDAVLVALAARSAEALRGVGELGRWGGDEFLALVPRVGDAEALCMADALCTRVAATPLCDGRSVTISCGVTVAAPGDSVDGLLQRADAALYGAKRAGRNGVKSLPERAAAGQTAAAPGRGMRASPGARGSAIG